MAEPTLLDRCVDAWGLFPRRREGVRRVLDHLAAEIIAAQQLERRQLSGDEICRMLLQHHETTCRTPES